MTQKVRDILNAYPRDYVQKQLERTYNKYLRSGKDEQFKEKMMFFLKPILENAKRLSDIEKAQLIYSVISRCVIYNSTDKDKFYDDLRGSYVGCIAYGSGICMGISELYTILCSAIGLKVVTVVAYAGDLIHEDDPNDTQEEKDKRGVAHAWNIIWLQNNGVLTPYHVDLTWDLAHFKTSNEKFRYFLKSDDYMREHNHEWKVKRYPRCPENRTDFPRILPSAIDFMCDRFEQTQNSLSSIKFIREV